MRINFRGDPGCLAQHCVKGLEFDLKLKRINDPGSSDALTELNTAINSTDFTIYLTEVRKSENVDENPYSFDLICVNNQGNVSCFVVESDANYNVRSVSQQNDINNLSAASKEAYEEMQEAEVSMPQLK